MSKTNAKKLRQKKRKKKEDKEKNKNKDLFLKITGVDATTNAYYALQENSEYTHILVKADKAIVKTQNKDTRDRALNHLVRHIITSIYNMERFG
jgi:hypothetical protein